MHKRTRLAGLSVVQQAVYKKMKSGQRYTAQELRASLSTLYALNREGLIHYTEHLGAIMAPRNCIEWERR